jgi:hypothetical protein
MKLNDVVIDVVAHSTISVPVFTGNEFYEEQEPCIFRAKWYERTGVIWVYEILSNGVDYSVSKLSPEHIGRFEDAALEEICYKHF